MQCSKRMRTCHVATLIRTDQAKKTFHFLRQRYFLRHWFGVGFLCVPHCLFRSGLRQGCQVQTFKLIHWQVQKYPNENVKKSPIKNSRNFRLDFIFNFKKTLKFLVSCFKRKLLHCLLKGQLAILNLSFLYFDSPGSNTKTNKNDVTWDLKYVWRHSLNPNHSKSCFRSESVKWLFSQSNPGANPIKEI